jgi:hypothetical protein
MSSRCGVHEVRLKGLGYRSAGQSGEVERLPKVADADSEGVEDPIEERQTFEAEAISRDESAQTPTKPK